jgi:hypothetical protein
MFFSDDDTTFLSEVKEILPVSVSTDREKLWPFLEQAERKYILPLMEEDLFNDISKFYSDHDNWTSGRGDDETKSEQLLKLIRIAELNLAYFIGFDLLNAKLSDAGFQRTESENFKGLYKYQEENLRKYFESSGYNGLDDMLKFIEDNIEHFPEWEESSVAAYRKTAIIKDAATFDSICFINKSRLTFLRLQRYMSEVIDFEIKPLLATEWDTLQEELDKEDPDEKYVALIPYIQKPLAYLSCTRLIEMTGNLTDRGLFFEGKNSLYPDDTTRKPAEGDSALLAMNSYLSTGRKYLEALRQYLIDNAFMEYGATSGSVYSRDNDNKKTFVA